MNRAAFLTAGNALTALTLFLRNILAARLLSVEDYGIAATFAVTMALIEMLSQLGLDRMIVQDREGDTPRLQAVLQGFHALRGAIGALLLFAIAAPYAAFLGLPALVWAYQAMALVPLARGLFHFDIYRAQRRMAYRPFIVTELIPAALSLIALWPLVDWLGDWRAMLVAILGQQILMLILSHLQAHRAYRMAWDRALMLRAFAFGWPLLVNGALLFLVFNGERLLVGRELGMAALGLFSMAVTLTLTPSLVAARTAQSFFLPQLSARQDDAARFAPLAFATMEASFAIGLLLALGVAAFGAPFVEWVLGAEYLPMLPWLAGLAIVNALRVAKTGAAVVAMARARTGNAALANLPRVVALPLIWLALIEGQGVGAVIAIAILAETLGLLIAFGLVHVRLGLNLLPLLPGLAGLGLTLLLLGLKPVLSVPQLWGPLSWLDAGLGLAGLGAFAALAALRRYVRGRIA